MSRPPPATSPTLMAAVSSRSSSLASHGAASPATFMYLLKDCYFYGTLKATAVQDPSAAGFSHMLISSLRHLKSVESVQKDFIDAKCLAARLVLDILASVVPHEERILVKLLETFDIELKDMAHALCGSELGDEDLAAAREHLKQHVQCFMQSESYVTAVALITRFSIQCCDEKFLIELIGSKQYKAAEEWAAFMGKEMIILIIQKYVDVKMLKSANALVKQYDLAEEFPDVNYLYKESSLKKLAEKGCWDVAEVRAKKDTKLMEYLVYLAMEAGYIEKVAIIQIASDKKAFIFDLIKLYEDDPKALDCCFRRIMCSSNILKLGYNLQCDLHQLTQSYGELLCFQSYEMLLDIQKLFKETTGGLSGLSKKILGAGLNKTRRNSDWEQRPLSQNQKEYAALDAAVLVHIFHHVRGQPQFGVNEGREVEWRGFRVNRARAPHGFRTTRAVQGDDWGRISSEF
ncbi:hypothetical protein ZWY2020_006815 [Hordeum vulgare]|nr:hypothetical protein ZWY2020_006815 [Hordeum vulgare]